MRIHRRALDEIKESAGFTLRLAVDVKRLLGCVMQVGNRHFYRAETNIKDAARIRVQGHRHVVKHEHTVDAIDPRPARCVIEDAIHHLDRDLEFATALVERETVERPFQHQSNVIRFARQQTVFQPFIRVVTDFQRQIAIHGVGLAAQQVSANICNHRPRFREDETPLQGAIQIRVNDAFGSEIQFHAGGIEFPVGLGVELAEAQVMPKNVRQSQIQTATVDQRRPFALIRLDAGGQPINAGQVFVSVDAGCLNTQLDAVIVHSSPVAGALFHQSTRIQKLNQIVSALRQRQCAGQSGKRFQPQIAGAGADPLEAALAVRRQVDAHRSRFARRSTWRFEAQPIDIKRLHFFRARPAGVTGETVKNQVRQGFVDVDGDVIQADIAAQAKRRPLVQTQPETHVAHAPPDRLLRPRHPAAPGFKAGIVDPRIDFARPACRVMHRAPLEVAA